MPLPKFFGKRSATKSTLRDPEVKLPSHAPETPNVAPRRTERDAEQEAEATQAVEEEIETTAGGNTGDRKQPVKPKVKTTTVSRNVASSTSAPLPNSGTIYKFFWNQETEYALEDNEYTIVNQWTPNAEAMFNILRITEQYSAQHRDIIKRHPDYLHYGTVCYYAFVYYIQILRARRAAGKLDTDESRFLRAFERDFKFEEMPIASPLIPFFSSIVSSLPEDDQFDWVVPRICQDNFYPTLSAFDTAANRALGSNLLQPMVPFMLSILRHIIGSSPNNLNVEWVAAGGEMAHWDDNGQYVAANLSANAPNATTIWGTNIPRPTAAGVAAQNEESSFFASCGLREQPLVDLDQLELSRRSWNQSQFAEFNVVPCGYATAAQRNVAQVAQNRATGGNFYTTGATPIDTIDRFMMMPVRKLTAAQQPVAPRPDWFNKLITNATIHAKCFSGTTHLSEIPVIGGHEPLVIGHFHHVDATVAANADYADHHVGLNDHNRQWYPIRFRNMTASFNTKVVGISREEELQALTFNLNSSLPVGVSTVGAVRLKAGEVHTHAANLNYVHRSGPFFTEGRPDKSSYAIDGNVGKPMFDKFERVIARKLWIEHL